MDINSIFRRGINKVNNRFDKRRIVFVNVTLIMLFFASFGAIIIADTPALQTLSLVTTPLIFIFYLLHGFYPRIIIKAAMLYFQFVIFMHSSVLEQGLYIEYGYVVLTAGLPVLFRRGWSIYFLISSAFLFYYPFLVLDVYDSYFEIGFIPGVILFFVMTTFVKETEINEERLLAKNKELINLNKEKNSLIGIVAHDLKSPLNQIRGLVNLIGFSENKLPDDVSEYINRISNSSEKMSEMISQILNTELLEKKKMVLDLAPISPAEIMNEVVKDFEFMAKEKDITINNLASNSMEYVLGDRQSLLHIAQNLLSNAIKFSPFHTQIDINIDLLPDKLRMKVVDHGPGISDEDKSKLFKKYQSLSAKPTGGEISTGLGLAIVKKFVNAMNSKIWCESEEGKGATFIVEMNRVTQ